MSDCNDPLILTNQGTYGQEELALLSSTRQQIDAYFAFNKGRYDARLNSLTPNPHAEFYNDLLEQELLPLLLRRDLVGWHYTRLLPFELDGFTRGGIRVSNLDRMRERIGQLQVNGNLTAREVDELIAASPLWDPTQAKVRQGKFWFISPSLPVSHHAVELLLDHWGGEVVYFWQGDTVLNCKLQSLGEPTVIEISVPLAKTTFAYNAARYMAEKFSLGEVSTETFDFYVSEDFPPEAIRRVYRPHDQCFHLLGRKS